MSEPTLICTQVNDVIPLDMQMGVAEPLCVPPNLHDQVLGGDARLIALIDAAKILGLVERLEPSETPNSSLFRRSDTLDDVAPWLVEWNGEDKLLRDFFTDVPGLQTALWPRSVGVLFRTHLPVQQLRQHLRRFLRVEKNGNQPYFFRFWESHVASAYFGNLSGRPEQITRWFCPREGGTIDAILVPDAPRARLWSFAPSALPPGPPAPVGSFALDTSDMAVITHAHSKMRLDRMTQLLVDTFPEQADAVEVDLGRLTRRTVGRMREFGVQQIELVFVALAWELFYGPGFENCDPEGKLKEFLCSDLNEPDKMKALKDRMHYLEETSLKKAE